MLSENVSKKENLMYLNIDRSEMSTYQKRDPNLKQKKLLFVRILCDNNEKKTEQAFLWPLEINF